MYMRVRERGDEIQIELTGVAGRHERILQAVFECRQAVALPGGGVLPEVSVKTRSNAMRICLRAAQGQVQPDTVYRSLRQALFSSPALA
jgi:hypothetical protein